MTIIQINSMLSGGGTDDQCLKLSRGLQLLKQEVIVAGPAGTELAPFFQSTRLPLHVLPSKKVGFTWGLRRLINKVRPDVVHAHHGRDYWPTVIACWLSATNPKIVFSRHLAKSPSSWLSKRFLLSCCDVMVAVSQFVATILTEGIKEPMSLVKERRSRPPMSGDHSKVLVIHGGIDTDKFHPMESWPLRKEWNLGPAQFAFAVVGAYDFPVGKGQREFVLAANKVKDALPEARFLIIGRGTMKDFLNAEIERLGLQGRAWLTSYVSNMPEAMNAIDCLVHPAQGTEAFGLVLVEAFACHKPVIATRLDGVPEAFAAGKLGCLIDSLNPEDIAKAMLTVAQNRNVPVPDSLRVSLSRDFSLESMSRSYLETYQRLIRA